MIVPTLCVGVPPWTLRVCFEVVTRSVTGCIPTRSVGTIYGQAKLIGARPGKKISSGHS